MEETTNVKVVGKSSDHVRFVCVGVGAGGSKIATCLSNSLPNEPFQIAINSSYQDLEALTTLTAKQKFKIGGANINGAGKDRNRAKKYYKEYKATIKGSDKSKEFSAIETFIMMYEEVLFHPTTQTIIIVSFSDDGGTGSGIGPIFGTALTNFINNVKEFYHGKEKYEIDDEMNTVPRPVVICLTPKCSVDSGAMSLKNAIESKSEIQKAIDMKIGNWLMADNNINGTFEYNSMEDMYNKINAGIVTPLIKFLSIEQNSGVKCLDLQDKINALRIPGASSFVTISDRNKYQYVEPKGQAVNRVIPIINADKNENGKIEKEAEELIRDLDIIPIDKTVVFFETDKTKLEGMNSVGRETIEESMICFFGFNSIGAIVEDLRANLHRTVKSGAEKENVVKSNSTGFDSITKDSKDIEDRFSSSKTMYGNDQINDLF